MLVRVKFFEAEKGFDFITGGGFGGERGITTKTGLVLNLGGLKGGVAIFANGRGGGQTVHRRFATIERRERGEPGKVTIQTRLGCPQ